MTIAKEEDMQGKSKVFIVGCGYVGRRLAHLLREQCDVLGLVRSNASLRGLRSCGVPGVVVDIDTAKRGELAPIWTRNAVLFYLVPPQPSGESDLRLDRFLQLLTEPPACFVYVSTTGVYGDAGGAQVDESTPVHPVTERARRRVTAEHMTRVWCHENGVRRVVLRVPGIYGPGRLPLERLRRQEPAVRASEAGTTNRIHVDDLLQVCRAVAYNESARGVYNVTDGSALSSTEYLRLVARLAALPAPPEIPLDEARLVLDATRMSFLEESRRVSNRRMLQELGIQLRYPDVEDGIKASLLEENDVGKKR